MASNYFGYSDDSPVRYPRTDRVRFGGSSGDDAPVTTPGDTYTRFNGTPSVPSPTDPTVRERWGTGTPTNTGAGGGTTTTTTPTYAYKNQLGVLNWDKFNDTSYIDPKYAFLRLAAQYGVQTQAQRDALLAALRADSSGYFTNATLDGDVLNVNNNDKAFGGISQFDVVRGMKTGNGTIAWSPLDAYGNQITNGGTASGAASPTSGLTSTWGQNESIIKAIEAIAQKYGTNGTGTGTGTGTTVGGARSGVSGTTNAGASTSAGTSATTRATGTTGTTGGTGTTTGATGSTGAVWKSLGGLDSASAITKLYQTYYGRNPTSQELNAQIGAVNSNRNALQQIEYNLNYEAQKAGIGPYGASASSSSAADDGGIFTDPLGSEIENLVNQNVSRLTRDVSDPVREQYARLLQEAIKYYSGDTFSKSENAAIRASAFDTLERDHQNARKTTLEQLAQRGIDPSSGVAVSALREVDAQYETLKGQQQQGLNTYALNANQTRRQNLLSTGEAATNLETAGRNEYNTNQATALSLLGLLSDLEGNRFNQSLALTGQSSATQSSLSSTLSGLISNLQNQGYLSSQQAAQLWSQVGSSLGNVVNSYPTGTSATSTPTGFTNGGAFNLPTQFQALYLD